MTASKLSSNSGSAVLLVMILAALLAIISMGYVDSLNLFSKETSIIYKKSYRSMSMNQIRAILSTTSALLESADYLPENQALAACVRGGAIGACSENCCQGNITTDMWIIDPMDTLADIRSKKMFSGPVQKPISYREDGSLCNPLLVGCAYYLTSQFKAHCPGGAVNCDHAEHIETTITLTANPGFPLIKNQVLKYHYFPQINYQPALPDVADQALMVGESRNIDLVGDSGHPSEKQNFLYEKCLSSNSAAVTVNCLTFENGVLQIQLQGLSAGESTVTLQINDRGGLNNLSKEKSFKVNVGP